jgi:hypothetical protein
VPRPSTAGEKEEAIVDTNPNSSECTTSPERVESYDGRSEGGVAHESEDHRRAVFQAPPFAAQLEYVFFEGAIRILTTILFFGLVPAGFALNYRHGRTMSVFFVNFFAIIPCAALQSLAVGEISELLRFQFRGEIGDIFEGLISSSFGYVLIFAINVGMHRLTVLC